jgi:hypothetical protein
VEPERLWIEATYEMGSGRCELEAKRRETGKWPTAAMALFEKEWRLLLNTCERLKMEELEMIALLDPAN